MRDFVTSVLCIPTMFRLTCSVQYNMWWPPFFNVFFPANYAGNRRTVTEAYFRLSLSPIVSRRGLTILEKEGGRENDRDREEEGRGEREREKGFRVRDKNSPRSSMTIAFHSSTVTAAWFGETRTEWQRGESRIWRAPPSFFRWEEPPPAKTNAFFAANPTFQGFFPIPGLTLSTDLYHSTDAVHTHRLRNGPEIHINT